MPPALLSLILIAVHASVPADCRPRLQDSEEQHQQGSSLHRGTHDADSSAGTGRFHSQPSGSERQGVRRDFLVLLPVRTASSNFVSIFDLRRKRFLCMSSKGDLYDSRQRDREDCLFQRIWLDLTDHRDVFYSTSASRLLRLGVDEERMAHREPPEPSSALLERFLSPLVRRRRRSEEVNPSDPLRSESHPSHSAKDHKDSDYVQPEQEQPGAASKEAKETITSCDDPLRVLQSNGPGSPVKSNIAERANQE
ncbi:fibroblast growth factor 23-like [Mugil cephalus]|uniref:fibroblast growth factor 23-like n=1 Tax=Mugil cephalus TaxID=48193 RepID=UPI001FB59BD9|nr:fibroblast growth factor 23-like [Mugil cephalus]